MSTLHDWVELSLICCKVGCSMRAHSGQLSCGTPTSCRTCYCALHSLLCSAQLTVLCTAYCALHSLLCTAQLKLTCSTAQLQLIQQLHDEWLGLSSFTQSGYYIYKRGLRGWSPPFSRSGLAPMQCFNLKIFSLLMFQARCFWLCKSKKICPLCVSDQMFQARCVRSQ